MNSTKIATPLIEDPKLTEDLTAEKKLANEKILAEYEAKKRQYVNDNSWGLLFFDEEDYEQEFIRNNPPPNIV